MEKNWIYKKIGEVCIAECGGSPRPIDQFITDSEDGINWIKIGDTTDNNGRTEKNCRFIGTSVKDYCFAEATNPEAGQFSESPICRDAIWKDDFDNQLSELLTHTKDFLPFPATCPVCRGLACHVYYHRYNESNGRGGSWVWCSHCHHFSHFSSAVPEWWINISNIDTAQLSAIPDYLESKKEMIDNWLNKVLTEILEEFVSDNTDIL